MSDEGKHSYEETETYQTGVFYKKLGEAMMNPKTSIQELVVLARSRGLDLKTRLEPMEEISGVASDE